MTTSEASGISLHHYCTDNRDSYLKGKIDQHKCQQWESHPDLAEIIALQGRKEEGTGEREEEEEGEDADDDGDDDEDEGFGHPAVNERKGPTSLTVNMFDVLRENECE
ncbi:unnamed protein product [Oncorhynchus mykiss]|uniref:Uncharacterized protein n=1 Tax=Oncorhynchus mykiss TaxID=8022 RepID=A0A060WI89_ONCMY|nr:unnamed protein product [Oncorhynchus mykiss]